MFQDEVAQQPQAHLQEIALLYLVMAQGALYNIEIPYNDASADKWLQLSEQTLVQGHFLTNNMIPGMQTLVCAKKRILCVSMSVK